MKLTRAQMSAAVLAVHTARSLNPMWMTGVGEAIVADLEVAVPYLQLQWEPPTPEECDAARRGLSVRQMLNAFVETRNAKLAPKPEDPRLRTIVEVISARKWMSYEAIAGRIIEALDGKDE